VSSAPHSLFRRLVGRVRYFLDRDRHERELREEVAAHTARAGTLAHLEEARAVWIPPTLDSVAADLRYGVRQLLHNPLYTAVALSGLALAIGLNAAVFSVVNAIAWRPLPVKQGDRVVRVLRYERVRAHITFTDAEFRHYRQSGALEEVTASAIDERVSADWPDASAPRALTAFTGPNYFDMLGGQPILGRLLQASDTGAVALLSEAAWKRRVNSRPDVVGSKLVLNGFPFTVVGVVADRSIAVAGTVIDVVAPLDAARLLGLADIGDRVELTGRVAADSSIDQAQVSLGVASARWFAAHPEDKREFRLLAVPARLAAPRSNTTTEAVTMALLLGAVLLVLVIACANLTNLLLARAEARRMEIAVRLSLGAGRARLVRQLLTECLLMCSLAGALGLAAANGVLRAALAAVPRYLPASATTPWLDLSIDFNTFAFTFGVCAATTFIFGLAPALAATRPNPPRRFQPGQRLRGALVAGQIAACMVLLIATVTVVTATDVLGGFLSRLDVRPVVQVPLMLDGYGYKAEAARELLQRARQRAAQLPNVEAAAISRHPLLSVVGQPLEVEVEGRAGSVRVLGESAPISPGCLRVFGLALARGRDLTAQEADTDAGVALVNETLARTLFADADPLGRRIRLVRAGKVDPWREVVGVVSDRRDGSGATGQSMYVPTGPLSSGFLQVRTRGNRSEAMVAVRGVVREMDPRIAANVNSVEDIVNFIRMGPRLVALGALTVGLAAMLMSAIGLYGVTAYVAERRTREIGIRMALGAHGLDVLRLVLRQGSRLVLAGLVVGAAAGIAVERLVASLAAIVRPQPPWVYAAVCGFLAAVAFLAMFVPSRRATRIDPLVALRQD
jgi:predicted permease